MPVGQRSGTGAEKEAMRFIKARGITQKF